MTFLCNLCGAECERGPVAPGREDSSCAQCGSTGRLRSLAALVARELFGVPLILSEFPVLKGVRAIGMSDPPALATRLEEKLDYINTYYHQRPMLDVTKPPTVDAGRFDFVISSEVMEHVPPPVEQAFANLCALLKPDGFLLLTVPYQLTGPTEEHFPDLHEYSLASLGGRTVLVNRRRDGSVDVHENLCFHGGHGSTLEMRVFTEESLKKVLVEAGFAEVEVASQNFPEFGVEHTEPFSLPIVARKRRRIEPPPSELASAYRDVARLTPTLEQQLTTITNSYKHLSEHHTKATAELEKELAVRLEWIRKLEADYEDRTRWALSLEKEKDAALAEFKRVQASEIDAWQQNAALERKLGEARAAKAAPGESLWSRIGRKLGLLS